VDALVAVAEALSVAWMVNANTPAPVGVPAIVPDADMASPGGKAPAAVIHVYGGLPPVAARTWE
jgi:hypothetical protein